MTEGEYRVGISFNPSADNSVDTIKGKIASLIDYVLEQGKDQRSAAIAATSLEEASMWAVKSVTKPERK